MKIVIAVEEFDPDKGYLEYYLAKELTKLGHKVWVLTFGWGKHILRTRFVEGFEVIRIPPIATWNGLHIPCFNAIIYIVKFIKKERPDVIHCQPLFSPLSLIFIWSQRLSKHKIVGSLITGEYSISSTIANLKYEATKIVIEHYVENKADSIFAVNDGWKKILLELFDLAEQKISLVPLGVDIEIFKFDAQTRISMRDRLHLFPDNIVVVYSGKITSSKKLHLLVKAIAPIMMRNQKVKLLIVGDGESSYLEHLKELCSNLKVSNNVIFHPSVHRTKLAEFYSASDVAVWPGSVSISIIEAASVGLPVIIKRTPITKFEIEYDNGFAFEPENVIELNSYLEKLVTNHELRKDMGKKSRLLVEQKLNWQAIARQYLDAYRKSMVG